MENESTIIKLLGKDWPATLPDFATRDEICLAWAESEGGKVRLLRIYAAFIGLCTPVGKAAKLNYIQLKCDPYVYGGHAYQWLREKGVKPEDVRAAGVALLPFLTRSLAPRAAEVIEQTDFIPPPAA